MPQSEFKHVKVSGIVTVVPPTEICIYDEAQYYDNSVKKIDRMRKMVGFHKRRVAEWGVTASDLAIDAGKKLIAGMKLDKNSVDALIFIVQKPDVVCPATAFYIHDKLGLPKSCMAFDINQGCPGWVVGLHLAHGMIESGSCKKILLLTGDTPAEYLDPSDRQNAPLFGDSAAATLIERDDFRKDSTFFEIGSDGSGFEYLIKPGLGERLKFWGRPQAPNPDFDAPMLEVFKSADGRDVNLAGEDYMNGLAVFNFTMNVVPQTIKSLMQFAKVEEKDIPYLMLHQANKQIIQTVASSAGFPVEKAPYSAFENYGNQTISSIPSLICREFGEVLASENKKMLCSSFGNGLSWASCVISMGNMYCGGVSVFEKPADHMDRKALIEYWKTKIQGSKND